MGRGRLYSLRKWCLLGKETKAESLGVKCSKHVFVVQLLNCV